MYNHALACVVLPLNGFGSTNLILIFGQLLFAFEACTGVIAGLIVICKGREKNSMDGPACCSTIVFFFLLSFKKLINIRNIMIYQARYFKKKEYYAKKKF